MKEGTLQNWLVKQNANEISCYFPINQQDRYKDPDYGQSFPLFLLQVQSWERKVEIASVSFIYFLYLFLFLLIFYFLRAMLFQIMTRNCVISSVFAILGIFFFELNFSYSYSCCGSIA